MAKTVFVVGLDPFNRRKLDTLEASGEYVFRPLLEPDELVAHRDYPLEAHLEKAARIIERTPGGADAIIGFWDFPVSLLVPLLCARFGLVSAPFESALACEHKYWSRVEQRESIPEHTPAFEAVDPFDDAAVASIGLDYPFWLKPIKAFSSHLGFRVRNRRDLDTAVAAIRRGIPNLGAAFNRFLAHAELPAEVAGVDGYHCIAEEIISGRQCTLEGFVHGGEVEVYGVVDSIRHANRSSFARYQYPSRLPRSVKARMAELARRAVSRIGLDDTPFNVEFFWDATRDQIWALEINPRISQSHGDLFEKVDGTPHHRVLVELALGRRPEWHKGGGPFGCAAKFFLRRFRDARVTRVPRAEEIARLQQRFPGTLLEVHVSEGMRLSEVEPQDQDSYSYVYALLFMGARDPSELLQKYRACLKALPFRFSEAGRLRHPPAASERAEEEQPAEPAARIA